MDPNQKLFYLPSPHPTLDPEEDTKGMGFNKMDAEVVGEDAEVTTGAEGDGLEARVCKVPDLQ